MSASWTPTPTPHHAVRAGFHVGYAVRDGPFGQGLFATHDIPSGTLLWKYRRGARGDAAANVLAVRSEAEARERLKELTPEQQVYWMDHVYMFEGALNEILDDGKLWNHSETPCTGLPPPGDEFDFESSYSIRDIAAGEELLDDYGLYEYPEWCVGARTGVGARSRNARDTRARWKRVHEVAALACRRSGGARAACNSCHTLTLVAAPTPARAGTIGSAPSLASRAISCARNPRPCGRRRRRSRCRFGKSGLSASFGTAPSEPSVRSYVATSRRSSSSWTAPLPSRALAIPI